MTITFTFPSMNQTYFDNCRFTSLAIALVTLIYSPPSRACDPEKEWLDRPWEIRYFLHIESKCAFEFSRVVAKSNNSDYLEKGKSVSYLKWESSFPIASTLKVPVKSDGCKNGFVVVAINFDKNGRVLTPNSSGQRLRGRISVINSVLLTANDSPKRIPIRLAGWFFGTPGHGAEFAPAVCSQDDGDRYARGFDADRDDLIGNFGCREWTYQLRDSGRPYIDITSYEKQGERIKLTIGWGRFDVARKPIIGKDGKNWVCLHECPEGSAPGIIPDIESWAAKYGFPLPKRPERTPMFRDEDYAIETED